MWAPWWLATLLLWPLASALRMGGVLPTSTAADPLLHVVSEMSKIEQRFDMAMHLLQRERRPQPDLPDEVASDSTSDTARVLLEDAAARWRKLEPTLASATAAAANHERARGNPTPSTVDPSNSKTVAEIFSDAADVVSLSGIALANIYKSERNTAAAVEELERACALTWPDLHAPSPSPRSVQRWLGCYGQLYNLYAVVGRREEAELLERELEARLPWISASPGHQPDSPRGPSTTAALAAVVMAHTHVLWSGRAEKAAAASAEADPSDVIMPPPSAASAAAAPLLSELFPYQSTDKGGGSRAVNIVADLDSHRRHVNDLVLRFANDRHSLAPVVALQGLIERLDREITRPSPDDSVAWPTPLRNTTSRMFAAAAAAAAAALAKSTAQHNDSTVPVSWGEAVAEVDACMTEQGIYTVVVLGQLRNEMLRYLEALVEVRQRGWDALEAWSKDSSAESLIMRGFQSRADVALELELCRQHVARLASTKAQLASTASPRLSTKPSKSPRWWSVGRTGVAVLALVLGAAAFALGRLPWMARNAARSPRRSMLARAKRRSRPRLPSLQHKLASAGTKFAAIAKALWAQTRVAWRQKNSAACKAAAVKFPKMRQATRHSTSSAKRGGHSKRCRDPRVITSASSRAGSSASSSSPTATDLPCAKPSTPPLPSSCAPPLASPKSPLLQSSASSQWVEVRRRQCLQTQPPAPPPLRPPLVDTLSSTAAAPMSQNRRLPSPHTHATPTSQTLSSSQTDSGDSNLAVLTPAPAVVTNDSEHVGEQLQRQIEFYFSTDNLCRDLYLRAQMDDSGFVPLDTIMRFNRIKALGAPAAAVLKAIRSSTLLDVLVPWAARCQVNTDESGGAWVALCRVRTNKEPERWVLQTGRPPLLHGPRGGRGPVAQ